jgi:hypothetical protein
VLQDHPAGLLPKLALLECLLQDLLLKELHQSPSAGQGGWLAQGELRLGALLLLLLLLLELVWCPLLASPPWVVVVAVVA